MVVISVRSCNIQTPCILGGNRLGKSLNAPLAPFPEGTIPHKPRMVKVSNPQITQVQTGFSTPPMPKSSSPKQKKRVTYATFSTSGGKVAVMNFGA